MKKILKVNAGVRYPEDAKVNGIEENDENPKMPFLDCLSVEKENFLTGKKYTEEEWRWKFEIDVATGIIIGWPSGTTACSYYKVCDDCMLEYYENDAFVCNNDGEYYVPGCLCLDEEGYGDYMELTIDKNGQIQDWSVNRVNEWIKRHKED